MMDSVEYIRNLIESDYRLPLAELTEAFPVNHGEQVTTTIITLNDAEIELLKSGKMLINSGYSLRNYVVVYDPA